MTWQKTIDTTQFSLKQKKPSDMKCLYRDMFFGHIIQPQSVLKNDLEYIISGCFELVFLIIPF